jgi:hypothetical protein
MGTVERRIVGTAAVLVARPVAPEHVSSPNCRRPAASLVVSSLTFAPSMDGFGRPHLARKSNGEVGEERPSRRGIKTVALIIAWGSPQSDNCHKCIRLAQKDAAARVSGMRLAKAFGPVR